MKNNLRHLLALFIVVFCGLLGWWVGRDLEKSIVKQPRVRQAIITKQARPILHPSRAVRRDEFNDGTTVEIFASRRPGQVILRFPSVGSYDTFLNALAGSKVQMIDRLDRLRSIRLGYREWSDLSDLLNGENITTYDSLPSVPPPALPADRVQQGLVGFGDGLLPWLGVGTDRAAWGAGVRVAVLDSGVVPHPALPGLSRSIAITPFPADVSKIQGHGTAVASLIASRDPSAPGIAPAAEIISIRVSDESGRADSYELAAGILAAIDAGAQIINISMGTTENNPLIEEAVIYARDREVLIVAASGNSEQSEACYPAAYPSVISVGAVDARGEHLDFSNYGTYLSLTAPGYAVNAAWPGNRYATISGTSASAPIVSGAIAATMSSGRGRRMSASSAAEIVMAYADEAGIPGPDSEYGFGILNMARIMNRDISGILDAAITHQCLLKSSHPSTNDEIQVTIQNRGTALLVNAQLVIKTPYDSRRFRVGMLAPGAIKTYTMPLYINGLTKNQQLQISSRLTMGNSGRDATPGNNFREETLYLR